MVSEEEILKEFKEKISNPKEGSHSLWLVKEAIKFTLAKYKQKVRTVIDDNVEPPFNDKLKKELGLE